MAKTNVFIADPYNNNHIELMKRFEDKNYLTNDISNYLENISTQIPKDEYINSEKSNNSNMTCLFIEKDESIIDCCQIKYEKDRKSSYVFYPTINEKRRKIIPASTTYIFNNLGMEEIFISIDSDNKQLINDLEFNMFESLEQGKSKTIEFVKEKNIENDIERSRQWR